MIPEIWYEIFRFLVRRERYEWWETEDCWFYGYRYLHAPLGAVSAYPHYMITKLSLSNVEPVLVPALVRHAIKRYGDHALSDA